MCAQPGQPEKLWGNSTPVQQQRTKLARKTGEQGRNGICANRFKIICETPDDIARTLWLAQPVALVCCCAHRGYRLPAPTPLPPTNAENHKGRPCKRLKDRRLNAKRASRAQQYRHPNCFSTQQAQQTGQRTHPACLALAHARCVTQCTGGLCHGPQGTCTVW